MGGAYRQMGEACINGVELIDKKGGACKMIGACTFQFIQISGIYLQMGRVCINEAKIIVKSME